MIRILFLLTATNLFAFAGEKLSVPPSVALGGLLAIVGLFFWGIYKAVKTQDKKYAWALLPFVLLLFIMFFI
jgi:hypothetical protein